jgi:hypothetical protein
VIDDGSDGEVTPNISAEAIAELAESGGLCSECGGLHIPRIDVAILALNAERNSGVKIPFCHCESCPICREFREGLHRARSSQPSQSSWSGE